MSLSFDGMLDEVDNFFCIISFSKFSKSSHVDIKILFTSFFKTKCFFSWLFLKNPKFLH